MRNRPGEFGPVIRRAGDGIEVVELVWGLKPHNPEHGPVINLRSEGRAFPKTIAALSPPPSSSFVTALPTERDGGSLWPMAIASTLPAFGAQLRTAGPKPMRY